VLKELLVTFEINS